LPSPAAVLRWPASCSATFSDCASTVPLAVLRSAFSGDSVELSAGRHRLRIVYFQSIRNELALQLFVSPPGEDERVFASRL